MPQNYFITGEPKSGKTTLLKELIEELKGSGLKVGGFISPEERHHGTRTAFHVMDVDSGKLELLASVDGDGPKISKYHVDIKSFESVAVPSMERVDSYDVFFIDEIGRMELKSQRFNSLLDKVFDSDTPVIATLHQDYVDRYGLSGQVIALTVANRNSTYYMLLRNAKASLKRKPAKKAAKAVPAKKAPARKKAVKTKPEKKKVKKTMGKKMKAKKAAKKRPERRAPAKKAPEKKAAAKKTAAGKPKKKGIVHHFKDLIGF